MPSYAILGGTGNTGQALLSLLSESSDNKINAYCRSKSKLEKMSPQAVSKPNVKIFEGSLDDASLLADCMNGTTAVFLTVAVSLNIPGTTIAWDTAHSVVSALQQLRKAKPQVKLPRLIVLSSAAIDDHLARDMPRIARTFLLWSESYIYGDLQITERYLREQQDWVSTIFVKPGALTKDIQRGHKLSLDLPGPIVSFPDLAAGMIEIAESDAYDMKNVTVVGTGEGIRFPWENVEATLKGLLFHFFPWTYRLFG